MTTSRSISCRIRRHFGARVRFLVPVAVSVIAFSGVAGPDARADAPPFRYTRFGSWIDRGEVKDNVTGLTWMAAVVPQRVDWSSAAWFCDNGPYKYRLPTIRELETLVDESRSDSFVLDPNYFNTTFDDAGSADGDVLWASTTAAGNPGFAWGLSTHGYGAGISDKSVKNLVLCVR